MSFKQRDSGHAAVKKEGCCFCCCCYLGGLDNIQEVDGCFYWAIENNHNYVRGDAWINIDKYDLADKIASKYNKNRRQGIIKTNGKRSHFWVEDANHNEIYNSVRPGYGH